MLVLPASCSGKEIIANKKISSLLLTHMNLKKEPYLDDKGSYSARRFVENL
jgi:hypothetical protein